MIETLIKLGIQAIYLNIISAIYDKSTDNIIPNAEKLKVFSSKIRKKTRMPNLATYNQHNSGSLRESN